MLVRLPLSIETTELPNSFRRILLSRYRDIIVECTKKVTVEQCYWIEEGKWCFRKKQKKKRKERGIQRTWRMWGPSEQGICESLLPLFYNSFIKLTTRITNHCTSRRYETNTKSEIFSCWSKQKQMEWFNIISCSSIIDQINKYKINTAAKDIYTRYIIILGKRHYCANKTVKNIMNYYSKT